VDREQERLLRNFLLVRNSTRPSHQQLVRRHFGQHERLIDEGEHEFPLEFVKYLHLLVPDTLLQKIAAEVLVSREEGLERAGLLSAELEYRTPELGELVYDEWVSHEELEAEIGKLERTEHGLNASPLHHYCREHSTEGRVWSHLHTHLDPDDIRISRADKAAHRLGPPAFIAAASEDGALALVPYRMDSRGYDSDEDFDYRHFANITLAVLCDHPDAHDYSVLNEFQQSIEEGLARGG
jgi:hypothetical protein